MVHFVLPVSVILCDTQQDICIYIYINKLFFSVQFYARTHNIHPFIHLFFHLFQRTMHSIIISGRDDREEEDEADITIIYMPFFFFFFNLTKYQKRKRCVHE